MHEFMFKHMSIDNISRTLSVEEQLPVYTLQLLYFHFTWDNSPKAVAAEGFFLVLRKKCKKIWGFRILA